MCGLTRELVERPQLALQTVVFQTPHVRLSRDGSRQLTGRRWRWNGRRDEAALHRRFGRGVRWNGRQSAQRVYVHLLANVFLLLTPPAKQGNEQFVGERGRESLDTHCPLEHVEKHDVHRRKACDERAADAVLFRGELASEYRLAALARNDSWVIRELGEACS